MCCRRGIVLQASTALSNPPPSAEASPVTAEPSAPLLVLEQNVQAMRAVVQAQQTQLQGLQALQQSQPLVGLTTDQPWGLALEGLSLGLVALVVGAGAVLVVRRNARKAPPAGFTAPMPTSGQSAMPEFSDSMLYLADQDEEPAPPAPAAPPASVVAPLHDPQHGAAAAPLAHEDGDPALEYHRMALRAQGVSVAAGAGYIDSDRIPLEEPPVSEKDTHPIFSPSLSSAEFDQRAAAEEVERVRRYLAQRRADRAQSSAVWEPGASPDLPRAPAAAPPADSANAPLQHVDIHLDMDTLPPGEDEALEHTPLSDGASLLVALSEDACEPVVVGAPDRAQQEIDAPALPSAHVQLALAQEFRDLGLWDEARARLQEVLEQPDAGQHAQARALLEELQRLAPSAPMLEWPQEGGASRL